MTDAVDREKHRIGSADEPLQHPGTLLDAAIVVQEDRTGTLGKFS